MVKKKGKRLGVEKAKKNVMDFANRIRNRIAIAIGAAFGLVIALTWNDAIREGVNHLMNNLGITDTTYIYKIITAIIITIISVIGIIIVSRWAEKKK